MPIERLGPYRIERPLGYGGMGTVYAGIHTETGQRAAIKLLSEALAADTRFRERFMTEVETLKKLRHENIVTLLGYGEEEGRLFFVMELVEGPTLEAELRGGRRFTWREAAQIGVQVCAALKHAHDSGVIHRDLKPANLMLDRNGRVKLTDFGIAKLFGNTGLTLAGSMIGTPDFMSPEQTEGKTVTPRSDLYSLGAVLYALLAGRPPFGGTVLTQIVDRVRFEAPRPLRALVPGVPEPFDDLVLELLRKDPNERLATPQLLANLLQAMQHALPADEEAAAADGAGSGGVVRVSSATTVVDPQRPAAADSLAIGERATVDFPSVPSATPVMAATVTPVDKTAEQVREPAAAEATELGLSPAVAPTHFTTVTEEDWRRSAAEHVRTGRRRLEWLAIAVMGAVLAAIAGVFIYFWFPLSADALYRRITQESAAESPDIRYEEWLGQFLERFPDDPRRPEIEGLLADHQCRALREELLHKVRPLNELERRFLQGVELWERDQPEAAREQFGRIIEADDAGRTDRRDRRVVDAARHMLQKR